MPKMNAIKYRTVMIQVLNKRGTDKGTGRRHAREENPNQGLLKAI